MSVLTITELAEHIASYLWAYQLYACIRVNKTWYEAFVPFLWRTIPPPQSDVTTSPWTKKGWRNARNKRIFLELVLEDYHLFSAGPQRRQEDQQQEQAQEQERAVVEDQHLTLPSSSSSLSVLSRCGPWIQEIEFLEEELTVPVPKPSSPPPQQHQPTSACRTNNPHQSTASPASEPPTAQELLLHLLKHCPNIRSLQLHWWSATSVDLVFWKALASNVIPLLGRLHVVFSLSNKVDDTTKDRVAMTQKQLPLIILDACCSGRMRRLSIPTFRWPLSASSAASQEQQQQKKEGGGGENAYETGEERNQRIQQQRQMLMRSLRELSVRSAGRDHIWSRRLFRFLPGCTHLVSLKVDSIDNGDWYFALRECLALKKLEIEKVTFVSIQLLTSVLKTSGSLPSLNEIVILMDEPYCSDPATDEDIASMLGASTTIRWRAVELHKISPLGAEVIIEQHCSTIESLRFSYRPGLTSLQICRLLACSPKLHTLMTLTKHFYKPRASEGELYVEDFVDMDPVTGALRPWKCEASLRVFRVKVSGIPFQAPSFYQDQEQKQEEIQDQEHDLQRRVFQRLSRFQRLEDLALGHFHENYTPIDGSQVNADDNTTYYDQPYGQTGWDFSLHSGLGLLGGLKEMRRFSKKMTPPSTVGVDEVKWMVSQWPKLESIRGLVASPEKEETDVDEDVAEAQGKDDGQVVKWLEKHCPWIWVDRCDFWSNF